VLKLPLRRQKEQEHQNGGGGGAANLRAKITIFRAERKVLIFILIFSLLHIGKSECLIKTLEN
jgi:hypothetical protein